MNRMTHPLMQYMPQQMQNRYQAQPRPNLQTRAQQMAAMMRAMSNPAAFVKENLPGLPEQIANDPNQILQYMMQNLGVTQQDIQNAANQIPRF